MLTPVIKDLRTRLSRDANDILGTGQSVSITNRLGLLPQFRRGVWNDDIKLDLIIIAQIQRC